MNEMKPEDVKRALECCIRRECMPCPNKERLTGITECMECLMQDALTLLRENDAEIKRLNKEVDRLSQIVQYHDGHISDAQKDILDDFEERLLRAFPCANAILEKSICDIIRKVANNLREEFK